MTTKTVEPPRTDQDRGGSPLRAALVGLTAVPHLVCGILVTSVVSRFAETFDRLGVDLPLFTSMFVRSPAWIWTVIGVFSAAGVLVFSFVPGARRTVVTLHVAGALIAVLSYMALWMPLLKIWAEYGE